jgi:hypothetical protein
MGEEQGTLYDYERDGHIEYDKALIIDEDGTRKLVKKHRNLMSGGKYDRDKVKSRESRRLSVQRSRSHGTTRARKKHIR